MATPLSARSPCREPVGDGADDDVGAGVPDGGQQPPLVLQDPVTPSAGLDLEDEDDDLPAGLLCLPDVIYDRCPSDRCGLSRWGRPWRGDDAAVGRPGGRPVVW